MASDLNGDGAGEMWPELPLQAWADTYATLHMWTQIVGKIRMAQAPPVNHWWHSTLYVTTRGLTTGPVPHGTRRFQIDFDFIDHQLRVQTSEGETRALPLRAQTVADFYAELRETLASLGLEVRISTAPQEVADPIPFEQDREHGSYDPEYARRCFRVLAQSDRVLQQFRGRFLGKCSPVHFFWGSFDMAVTRFSGRLAPQHPGGVPGLADWVTRDAYSHEVSSCGFWPGGGPLPEPVFYAYAYPAPEGFRDYPVRPEGAYFHPVLQEFVLPYEAVRRANDPDLLLLEFLQSTYEAAAELGRWDRPQLEWQPPHP